MMAVNRLSSSLHCSAYASNRHAGAACCVRSVHVCKPELWRPSWVLAPKLAHLDQSVTSKIPIAELLPDPSEHVRTAQHPASVDSSMLGHAYHAAMYNVLGASTVLPSVVSQRHEAHSWLYDPTY